MFLRADFDDLGGYDQVGRALRGLVQKGQLLKLGYGIYTLSLIHILTLTPEEFDMVVKMRASGRTFSYIEEEIGVCHDVIRRALAERGQPTARIRKERRAKRGTGHWRSFD